VLLGQGYWIHQQVVGDIKENEMSGACSTQDKKAFNLFYMHVITKSSSMKQSSTAVLKLYP
jgi:hypothetical protein